MPSSVSEKGRGEVRNDSQVSGLGSWVEGGAEEGNTEEEQVAGKEGDSFSVMFLVIGLLPERASAALWQAEASQGRSGTGMI